MPYMGTNPDLQKSVIREGSATGDGSTVAFDMTFTVSSDTQVLVFLNGVKQDSSAYSVNTTTGICTFVAAPANTTNIDFVGIDSLGLSYEPSDNTVGTAKIVNNAVTKAKLSSDVQTSIETTDFVGSTTAVTSAVTSFTISGLDLNDGEEYIFDYWLNNTAGSTALYYIGVNGEDGTTGYQTQLSEFTNTTVTASKTTTGLIGFANTTRNATGFGRITMSGNSGVFVASDLHTNLGASPEHAMYRVWRDSTLSGSITSVKITSSVTNGIGVDSYFRIKRKVGAS